MTQRAKTELKQAYLNTDFAREFVTRQFGDLAAKAIYATLPTFTRGKRKGMVKGMVLWTKCVEGGWYRGNEQGWSDSGPVGYVMKPGTHDVRIVESHYGQSLEAGQRRMAETDQEWAERCKVGIMQVFNIKEGL